jgi:ribosomal protein S18 acetylase RimI-like enzyme
MTDITIDIHLIEPFRARDVAGTVGRIYREAYDAPDDAAAFVRGAFAKHATWPGFLLLIATFEGIPVGFIYGYDSRPGQWWHDTIREAMLAAGRGAWQDDAFELAEVAVDPAVQGRGIGTALIEAFLAETSGKDVLLSAMADPADRAKDLYRRFGFVDILPEFHYPGSDETAIIMGRKHPADDSIGGA